MAKTLSSHLAGALRGVHTLGCSVDVHTVRTSGEEVAWEASEVRASCTKATILINITSGSNGGGQIVFGAVFKEYYVAEQDATLVHLDKIDTTGACGQRSRVASIVVCAYVEWARMNLLGSTVSFHVFARTSPAYVFAGSGTDSRKKVLRAGELVKWWTRRMTSCARVAGGGKFVRGYVYDPNETEYREVGRDVRGGETMKGWIYGLWTMNNKSTKSITSLLPEFEDDPRTQIVQEHKKSKKVTDEEFYGLMATNHDNVVDRCSYLSIEFALDKKSKSKSDTKSKNAKGNDSTRVSDTLHTLLSSQPFKNSQTSTKSSKEILDFIYSEREWVDSVVGVEPSKDIKGKDNKDNKDKNGNGENPVVNILSSSLVKRKPVNDISSLVRKKAKN